LTAKGIENLLALRGIGQILQEPPGYARNQNGHHLLHLTPPAIARLLNGAPCQGDRNAE
jgi:hypothetical protein